MRILCVAEKASICKAIAHALGQNTHTIDNSISKFTPNYIFTYNFTNGWGQCDVVVTSVRGHVTELEFEPPFNDWGYDPGSLFDAPTKVVIPAGNAAICRNIREMSRSADILYIWTDCDREGEFIGSEIVDQAKKTNRGITVKRAIFNNVEVNHIKQAANRPGELDYNAVAAIGARRELDLRTGYCMTRFQDAFRRRFGIETPVSYGSCQFPTMGFVIDRYFKVRNFKPEKFWKIDLKIKKDSKDLLLNWDRSRLFDYSAALVLYERMLDMGGDATVTDIAKKPTKQFKPLPLTTVTLQKLGVKFLGLSAKQALGTAEKLYQKGFLSYPRTETDQFDAAIDLKALVGRHTNNPEFGTYATKLLDGKFVAPRKGKHNDKAHPPIHPVNSATKGVLKGDEWAVYEFVTRHFLACCSDDAKGEQTTVNVNYGEEKFHVSGVIVKELNYLEIYKYAKWNSAPIPDFSIGEVLRIVSCLLHDGKTTAPDYLTESELIALMDANGIGTDATMADHISKILDRDYVKKEKSKLIPTTLAVGLYFGYNALGLEKGVTKPLLRQETERDISKIATGEYGKHQALTVLLATHEKIYKCAKEDVKLMLEEAGKYMK